MKSDQVRPRFRPSLALVSGVLAVSTGAIFARLSEAPPLVTAAYRVGLATLTLLPFAWWKAGRELRQLSARDYGLAALSGLCLALHFATWISSLSYTSVANSVVLVNTNPVWVALLTPLVTPDRLSRRVWQSVGLSVTGGVIIGWGDLAPGSRALLGDSLALAGGWAAAGYLLLGRRLRARLSLLAYVTVCYGSAAVFLWTAVLASRLPVTGFPAATWWALLGMALISQNVGHTSYNFALRFFSASVIAVSLLGEPIGSSALAWLLFGERLTWLKAAGATLILGGIYVAATGTKRGPTPSAATAAEAPQGPPGNR
jgi:drug/metabolite transporter (DMT)-like permease